MTVEVQSSRSAMWSRKRRSCQLSASIQPVGWVGVIPTGPQGETHPTLGTANSPIPLGWLTLSRNRPETAVGPAETSLIREKNAKWLNRRFG